MLPNELMGGSKRERDVFSVSPPLLPTREADGVFPLMFSILIMIL